MNPARPRWILLLHVAFAATLIGQEPEHRYPNCDDDYANAMAADNLSDSDKQLATFAYRTCGKKILHKLETFSIADGVDDFEAWYIATIYRVREYGGCGMCFLPTRAGDDWRIEFGHGAHGSPGPTILVNATTGAARCAGHADFTDPMAVIRQELELLTVEFSKPPLSLEQRRQMLQAEAAKRDAEIAQELERRRSNAATRPN